MRIIIAVLTNCCIFAGVSAQDMLHQPDPAKHYLFYLHGRIIEDGDLRPTHHVWGLYDYPAVLEALGSRGAVVVSEQRPMETDIDEYAAQVRSQIMALVEAGVPQSKISVVGFSKGGAIAITISGSMPQEYVDIRYVFLAACTDWALGQPSLSLTGHVLSIFEASDGSTTSCKGLSEHDQDLEAVLEITIDTGADHGAFYLPRDVWVNPTLQWVHGM